MSAPRATYRLQLRGAMDFAAAAELCDYLAELGVSHLYASPYLQAARGSTHGYDVTDPERVDEALGGAAGHARLAAALAERGLGQLLDIVPNHMAIGTADNAWWWDVLENGPASFYAGYFDVDWSQGTDNRVVLPILGERYGDAVAQGKLAVVRRGGRFVVTYFEHALPAAPRSLPEVLADVAAAEGSETLAFWADALAVLPAPWATDRVSLARRHRNKAVITEHLERLFEGAPPLAAAVDRALAAIGRDPARLDAFLERQNWRVVYWRAAASELGYRRFFDVHTLAGLRAEDPTVFQATHRLVLRWLADGVLDGVRVDHVDGLRDPAGYLRRLRAAAPRAWIVVEKILAPGERLPESWPVDGATGYELMRLVDGVFVDAAAEASLTSTWRRFVGDAPDFAEVAHGARRDVLDHVLVAELERLVELAHAAAARPDLRDVTRRELREALAELLACFPVYRTYVRPGEPASAADLAHGDTALAAARARRPEVEARVWAHLRACLSGERDDPAAVELTLALQQISGAVMAKGVEDTAFYRAVRFVALNEVGGAPERFGVSLDELHRELALRPRRALSATATHDSKRGEDVRARLAALSEVPDAWAAAVERWSARADRHHRGPWPDGAMEYLIWQTLVGAWPIERERLLAYVEKAAREAKRYTSWLRPDEGYESALREFVGGVLDDAELCAAIAGFVDELAPAGYRNALARTLLKLTVPGVPDIYQGTELWDFSLVDPDNRRPVDFARRRALLARARECGPEDAMAGLADGLPKLWLIHRVLQRRRRAPERFDGVYRPLAVRGLAASRVIAFARGPGLAVVVPRLGPPPGGWGDTRVRLGPGPWLDALTEEPVTRDEDVEVRAIWRRFPVALLTTT